MAWHKLVLPVALMARGESASNCQRPDLLVEVLDTNAETKQRLVIRKILFSFMFYYRKLMYIPDFSGTF